MTAALAGDGVKANSIPATSCGRSRNDLRSNYLVMQKARALFPVKTARHLSELTGYSLRAVEYWLSGQTRIPTEATALLMRSEYGLEFLTAILSDARPAWWKAVRRALAIADQQQEKLREAVDAARSLNETIAQAEAALRVSDEEFHSVHIDAARGMGRVAEKIAPWLKNDAGKRRK